MKVRFKEMMTLFTLLTMAITSSVASEDSKISEIHQKVKEDDLQMKEQGFSFESFNPNDYQLQKVQVEQRQRRRL